MLLAGVDIDVIQWVVIAAIWLLSKLADARKKKKQAEAPADDGGRHLEEAIALRDLWGRVVQRSSDWTDGGPALALAASGLATSLQELATMLPGHEAESKAIHAFVGRRKNLEAVASNLDRALESPGSVHVGNILLSLHPELTRLAMRVASQTPGLDDHPGVPIVALCRKWAPILLADRLWVALDPANAARYARPYLLSRREQRVPSDTVPRTIRGTTFASMLRVPAPNFEVSGAVALDRSGTVVPERMLRTAATTLLVALEREPLDLLGGKRLGDFTALPRELEDALGEPDSLEARDVAPSDEFDESAARGRPVRVARPTDAFSHRSEDTSWAQRNEPNEITPEDNTPVRNLDRPFEDATVQDWVSRPRDVVAIGAERRREPRSQPTPRSRLRRAMLASEALRVL
ncbi:MAG: hypothetical protein IV100_25585 [Myxococcales bacterium]|nr:hypothetical protein [Myxococcales bacterium]